MTFDEYTNKALDTVSESILGDITYSCLGLVSEAGEVADKLKKGIRDHDGEVDGKGVAKELGDCLWYINKLASELGYSLEDIAVMNVEKLSSRKKRGVIGGSGDER